MKLVSALFSIALLVSACSETPDDPASIVADGPIAVADFCGVMDAVLDAARVDCCTGGVDAPAATCASIRPLLDDQAEASGVVGYDEAAAGDYLRELESRTGFCGDTPPDLGEVFPGELVAGADCTDVPVEVRPYACADDLVCLPSDDSGARTCQVAEEPELLSAGSSCDAEGPNPCDAGLFCDGEAAVCVEQQAIGESCDDGVACSSGSCTDGTFSDEGEATCGGAECVCAAAEPSFCQELDPPPNGIDGIVSPSRLCVTAADRKYAGTDDDIMLTFTPGANYSSWIYYCRLEGGISRGQERCCSPQVSYTQGDGTDYEDEGDAQMGVVYRKWADSGNGMCVENFKVKDGCNSTGGNCDEVYKRGTFDDQYDPINCDDCNFFGDTNCGRCWIDGDNGDEETGFAVNWNDKDVVNVEDSYMTDQWPWGPR